MERGGNLQGKEIVELQISKEKKELKIIIGEKWQEKKKYKKCDHYSRDVTNKHGGEGLDKACSREEAAITLLPCASDCISLIWATSNVAGGNG